MVSTWQVKNVTGPLAHHAEGPVWSESWGGLRYVDLTAGTLLTLRSGTVDRLDTGSPIAAFVRPRAVGGYVVALERGIGLADDNDLPPTRSTEMWSDPSIRMNDGATDPLGRLLAGSMAYNGRDATAAVYVIDSDLRSTVVVPNVTVSNGIAFSPDGSLAYYIDTVTGRVDVFDFVNGSLVGRRPFVVIDGSAGMPDGMTVSDDGTVWVALWGGSAVHAYSPSGQLRGVVELPVSQVSACTFGGDDLDILFITTSRQGLGDDEQPQAGSVFSARVGFTGLPVVPFAG